VPAGQLTTEARRPAGAPDRRVSSPEARRAYGGIIGESPRIKAALQRIQRAAACDATVLIEGETGTGKELAARAIHYLGGRSDRPFVCVNCGSLPDSLVENELFGHERGAYTDARDAGPGLVADAEGGTLFLDEVEAMSARTQVVLLRFLQDGMYRPIGGRRTVSANVRVIAASNSSLRELVRHGRFRDDLLYRLRLMLVEMPPLRDRSDDISVLARYFLQRFSQQYRHLQKSLSRSLESSLKEYPWPGNVRELENLLHRAVLMSDGDELELDAADFEASLSAPIAEPSPPENLDKGFRAAKASAIHAFERAYLLKAMRSTNGNVAAAARRAGKERRAFGKLLKKHGIDRRDAL
jgi:two-component system, NtrC family, response regulator GlrR